MEYVIKSLLLSQVLVNLMPNVLSPVEVATLREWVRQGCPAPGTVTPQPLALLVAAFAVPTIEAETATETFSFAVRRRLIGAGSVH